MNDNGHGFQAGVRRFFLKPDLLIHNSAEGPEEIAERKYLKEALSTAALLLLFPYFRGRLHQWFGLPLALSAALGLFLSWAVACFPWGVGKFSRRAQFKLIVVLSACLYVFVRLLGYR